MLEIEKDEKVVFKGSKEECIAYLRENGVLYLNGDERLLTLAHWAALYGFDLYAR